VEADAKTGEHDVDRRQWQPLRISNVMCEQATAAAAAAAATTAVARERRQRAASQRAASVGAPPRPVGSALGRKLAESAWAMLRSAPYYERGDVVSLCSYVAAWEPRMYLIAHALREPSANRHWLMWLSMHFGRYRVP